MAEAPFLSIIIPAYNEAERLPTTLVDMDKHLSKVDFSYEMVVVNDGSKDNTAEVVRKMAKDIPHLRLIDNEQNQGKGGVVRDGMLAVKGRYRLFTDADNSTSIDQFDKMRPHLMGQEGGECDVVIGSRAVKGSEMDPPEPFYRQIFGRAGNLLIQLLNLPGIWDSQCGFKCFTAEAAERIFTKTRVTGWGFDIEALALARAMGYKIKEVPVRWVNSAGSHVGLKAYLQVFVENAKIRWWLMTRRYDLEIAAKPDKPAGEANK